MSRSAPLKILIHEWATGGLAGEDVPRSWRTEGRAMRRSLAMDFAAVREPEVRVGVTLGGLEPDDPGRWTTLRMGGSGAWDELIDLARQVDYTVLIAPETTGLLARLARALEWAGARSLGSSVEAIELTGDKLRLMKRLQARGVPTPDSRLIRTGEPFPEDARFPAVLKPVDGAGSVDTWLLADAADAPAPGNGSSDALLQPFHEGSPMSASYLVADDGTPWLIGVGRQKVRIWKRRFHYCGGMIPAECAAALPVLRQALATVPGLRGFVGVDFLWVPDEDDVTVLEINPRVTTSHVGLARLLPPGRLAGAWLAACGSGGPGKETLASLADAVMSQPAIEFDADGDTWPGPRG